MKAKTRGNNLSCPPPAGGVANTWRKTSWKKEKNNRNTTAFKQSKVHSYRRTFFPKFQSLEIIGDMYLYTEALSLLSVKLSKSKTIKFVNIPIFEKKKGKYGILKIARKKDENLDEKYGRLNNCAKQMSKIWTKSSPIRMTLRQITKEKNKQ